MKLQGNTILITGGGSGIGRGLAKALHKLGNKVIISGRRKSHLDTTTKANPGMASVELDIAESGKHRRPGEEADHQISNLNVLINNAGIMQLDNAAANIDDVLLTSTLTTNLLGPIRTENKQITVQTAVSKVGSSDRRFSLLPVETTLLSLQL
jgi:uncharacterized oxidoreductase